MRILGLTRGVPGSGKSTFVQENGLKDFTLSPDDFRRYLSSDVIHPDGSIGINQSVSPKAWNFTMDILEQRMIRGDFTIIDATHIKRKDISKYKQLAEKYKYRVYIIDFTNVSLETAIERNNSRSNYKIVSNDIIRSMHEQLETETVPSGFTVVSPDKFMDVIELKPLNLDKYNRIHIIGDIHGCYTCFNDWLSSVGGYSEDEFYIFLGDYLDRGKENIEMLKFIMDFQKNPNVCCIEGNHEKHLYKWTQGEKSNSEAFDKYTSKELDESDIDKRDVKRFYRSLAQCGYFSYNGDYLVCTHGGINRLPDYYVPTVEYIKGTGKYGECLETDNTFVENTLFYPQAIFSFHGHRNIHSLPVKVNDFVYNLEGSIELGGCLRTVTIDSDFNIKTCETKNTVYKIPDYAKVNHELPLDNIETVVAAFRNTSVINEKKFGDISSFNFSKRAFYDAIWNAATIKARGLFINTKENKVVARGYEKFWTYKQLLDNPSYLPNYDKSLSAEENIKNNLKFPLSVYVKENGFLGMLSYDAQNDDFLFATKSSLNGDYVEYFKDIFYKNFKDKDADLTSLKNFLKDNNVTLVFEVIDVENDPHIIKYSASKIVLLDAIYNELSFKNYSFDDLSEVARNFSLEIKKRYCIVDSWEDFLNIKDIVSEKDFCSKELGYLEGFVVADSNNFLFKLKTGYYDWWKYARSIVESYVKYGNYHKTSDFDEDMKKFYLLLSNMNRVQLKNISIIELRDFIEQNKED